MRAKQLNFDLLITYKEEWKLIYLIEHPSSYLQPLSGRRRLNELAGLNLKID
jgi:hypothetical protein